MKNNYLVVGLGNPGKDYKNTRHNIGFLFLDYFLDRFEIKKKEYFSSYIISEKFFINNTKKIKAFFMYPLTYMNRTGLAVKHFLNNYVSENCNLIVIHDDIDMITGKVRLKTNGGHGGHNGVKSIINELQTKDFYRIKIGINRPEKKEDIPNYVLSDFSLEEFKIIKDSFITASNILTKLFFRYPN